MSGMTLVAVRMPEGDVRIWEQTNKSLAFRMTHPHLLDGGEGLAEWLAAVHDEPVEQENPLMIDGGPFRQSAIHCSEYGVTLVDLRDRAIFDRQGYTDPMRLGVCVDDDCCERLVALRRLGRLAGFARFREPGERGPMQCRVSDAEAAPLLALLDWYQGTVDRFGSIADVRDGRVRLPDDWIATGCTALVEVSKQVHFGWEAHVSLPEGWTIDHDARSARSCWAEVRAFLADHGWECPIRDPRSEADE